MWLMALMDLRPLCMHPLYAHLVEPSQPGSSCHVRYNDASHRDGGRCEWATRLCRGFTLSLGSMGAANGHRLCIQLRGSMTHTSHTNAYYASSECRVFSNRETLRIFSHDGPITRKFGYIAASAQLDLLQVWYRQNRRRDLYIRSGRNQPAYSLSSPSNPSPSSSSSAVKAVMGTAYKRITGCKEEK